MTEEEILFSVKSNFAKNEKIYQFTDEGKLIKTTQFIPPVCPVCTRREHLFEIDDFSIWCCPKDKCMEYRLINAGVHALCFPINFIGHVKKRNQFCNASFNNEQNIEDFSKKWSLLKEGKIKDIFLTGNLGTGKTYSFFAALKEVCKFGKGMTACFITETELYENIKNTWERESLLTEREAIQKYSSCDFLFLDDVGAATRTIQGEWGKQVLLDILDERINSLTLHTLISSNFIISEIEKMYGPRISDRMKLMTTSLTAGESRRKPFKSTEGGLNKV